MKDKVLVLDGSGRLYKDIPLEAIAEIAALREIDVEYHDCAPFLKTFIDMGYNQGRKQLNAYEFTRALHATQEMKQNHEAGKLIIVDDDLYSGDEDCNFIFGGLSEVPQSLGYILLSTARITTFPQARDVIRHELGHMFGAPSQGRTNTYQLYGLHCSNDLCVMQQKDSVEEARNYASQRAKLNSGTYCRQCEQDIKRFKRK